MYTLAKANLDLTLPCNIAWSFSWYDDIKTIQQWFILGSKSAFLQGLFLFYISEFFLSANVVACMFNCGINYNINIVAWQMFGV